VQRQIGDVLLAWENEAFLARDEAKGAVEIVMPSLSILAEPPVTIVDRNVDRKKTRPIAEAYLNFLYSPEAQEIIAKNHYRPRDAKVLAKYQSAFANVKLFTIDEAFGGWQAAQKAHFADGGTFDQIYKPGRR
jgi:sulfate transport system substrate-binding protein